MQTISRVLGYLRDPSDKMARVEKLELALAFSICLASSVPLVPPPIPPTHGVARAPFTPQR